MNKKSVNYFTDLNNLYLKIIPPFDGLKILDNLETQICAIENSSVITIKLSGKKSLHSWLLKTFN